MNKLLLQTLWLLLLPPAYGAGGTIADLAADWSDTVNAPNGWSYRAGTTPISNHFPNWRGIGQQAWAPGQTSTNFVPAFVKAASNMQGDGADLFRGDVGVYSWDLPSGSTNGAANGIANITWTSSVNAAVNIIGTVWNADLTNFRDNNYVLKLNGAILTSGTVINTSDTRARPVGFSIPRTIKAGDVLEMDIVKPDSQPSGTWAGLNLTISAVTETRILPQFAFGGGWYSTLYFTNTSADTVSVAVGFTANDGTPLTVPSVNGSSTTLTIPSRGTAQIEALSAVDLVEGYVTVALPAGVAGYAVFRQSVAGRVDQEAVVPLSPSSATTSTLIWDDTNLTTAVAIVNLSASNATITIVARDSLGATIGTSTVPLPPRGKIPKILRDLPGLSGMLGKRGSADFTSSAGNLAVLGLRFVGFAFTSIPTSDK